MKFEVTEGEKYQKVMTAEISPAEMELPLKFACKRLAQKVNIPGFRKGKAPRSILESFLGKEAILQEAIDDMLPDVYVGGLKDTGIQPCAQPQIQIVKMNPEEPIEVKFTVTVKPEIKLGEYKGLAVTRKVLEVQDEDVDHEIESQRQRMAKDVDAPEGDAAENGNIVTIDFKGMKDGVASSSVTM